MRLWSIHPRHLDRAGLIAVWREGLLAQAVLSGRTRGYTRHPQLDRFRSQPDPVASIAAYLHPLADEAASRGYSFDRAKLPRNAPVPPIELTEGQLAFECHHLLKKLQLRNPAWHGDLQQRTPAAHPLFVVIGGGIAEWERAALGTPPSAAREGRRR